MDSIYENIRKLAAERGMSLQDVEREANLGKNTIYYWKKNTPSPTSLHKIARCLNVPVTSLRTGEAPPDFQQPQDIPSSPAIGNMIQMPIIGSVRAGYGGLAVEDYFGEYKGVTAESLRGYPPNECRLLRVRGSSMYPTIVEGDTVLVHRQEDVESGEIAVILTEDEEATLKTVVKGKGYLELVPKNPEYQTKRFDNGSCKDIHIWGKVLTLFRDF